MSKEAESLPDWLEGAVVQLCREFKFKRNEVLHVLGRFVEGGDGAIPNVSVSVPGYTLVAIGTYRKKVPDSRGGRRRRRSARQARADQARAAHAKYLKDAAQRR